MAIFARTLLGWAPGPVLSQALCSTGALLSAHVRPQATLSLRLRASGSGGHTSSQAPLLCVKQGKPCVLRAPVGTWFPISPLPHQSPCPGDVLPYDFLNYFSILVSFSVKLHSFCSLGLKANKTNCILKVNFIIMEKAQIIKK